MTYQILSLLILFCFYAVYFGKMLQQKRAGIVTNQIAKGNKEKSLFIIESLIKVTSLLIVPVEIISIILNTATKNSSIQLFGGFLGIVGVLVFAISVYTMKDSWRAGIPEKDTTTIITNGIYKFSRNPAFLGFDLVYLGILCMFFNPILLVCTIFTIIIFHLQILQEEKYLSRIFAEQYSTYKNTVRRYI